MPGLPGSVSGRPPRLEHMELPGAGCDLLTYDGLAPPTARGLPFCFPAVAVEVSSCGPSCWKESSTLYPML